MSRRWRICSIPGGLARYGEIRQALSDLSARIVIDGTDLHVHVDDGDLATREAVYIALGVPDLSSCAAEA